MEKKNYKKLAINLVKWGVSILAIYYVFSKIDLALLWQQVKRADGVYLLLALLTFALSKFSSSLRLTLFWRNIGVSLSEGENIRLYLLGMFYNLFLPGGIGGDAYKVWLLHRLRYATVKPLAEAVLLDRINGLVAILMLLVALLPFFPALPFWIRMGAFLLLIGYLCYYLLIKYLFPLFLSSIHLTTVYSLGVQLLQCLSIYCIMKAIGIESDYLAWMFVFMLSSVVAVLPFTVGGLGARELVFLYSCRWLMIEGEAAVTISLLFYAITVIVSFLGIYYYIFPDRLGIETCEEGVEQVEN